MLSSAGLMARLASLAFVSLVSAAPMPAQAIVIGGVEFPQGLISFADAVVDYSLTSSVPSVPHQGAANALGAPNYTGVNSCASQAGCTFVSLGSGGSITLQFTDNLLTGSGDSGLDLWVFEVGPNVEDTFVEISKDGAIWSDIGKVFGSTAGIDIDAFGFGVSDQFAFVRLTDDPSEGGGGSGGTVGADIDAVGAISTVPVSEVPVPSTLILLAGLLPLIAARCRRA